MPSSTASPLRLTSFRQPALWASLALLLYGLGMAALLGVYAQAWLAEARQSVSFYVELKDDAKQADIFTFQKRLEEQAAVQQGSVHYISKEQALADWDEQEMGISKEELLIAGQNPLPNVLIWALSREYEGNLPDLVTPWKAEAVVAELAYSDVPLADWQEQIRQAEGLLLCLLLLFVAVVYVLLRNNAKLALREALPQANVSIKMLQEHYQRQSWRKGLGCSLVAIAALWGTRIWLENDWAVLGLNHLEFWVTLISGLLLLAGLALPWLAARGVLIKENK